MQPLSQLEVDLYLKIYFMLVLWAVFLNFNEQVVLVSTTYFSELTVIKFI